MSCVCPFINYTLTPEENVCNVRVCARDGVLVLIPVLVLTRVLFFSILSCTLYLSKFMSTCTRTYLSTVAKKVCTHEYIMSTTEYFLNFNQIGKIKLIVSQVLLHLFQMLLHLFQMPLICLFQT